MRFIWVTRGRSWGTQFLRSAGYADPLPLFEKAFSGASNDSDLFVRNADQVAFRFTDPEGRSDQSGRPIRHQFVVFSPAARQLLSLADGMAAVWPLVAATYAKNWDQPDASGLLEPGEGFDEPS